MTTVTTPIAIRHAWQIARAHYHHWAADATPAWLSFAASLPPQLHQAQWCEEHEVILDALGMPELVTTAARAAASAAVPPIPPATYEDAELLGRLPTCTGEGRTVPSLADDGSLSDGTGSGRVRWTCHASGAVDIWIDRPKPGRPSDSFTGVAVIHARVEGQRVRVERLGAYWLRHAASLSYVLRALDIPEREVRAVMLGAEDAGTLYVRPTIRHGESRESYFARADAAREAWLTSTEPLPRIELKAVVS